MFVKTFSIVAIAAVATFGYANIAEATVARTSNGANAVVAPVGAQLSDAAYVEANIREDRDNLVSTSTYKATEASNIGGGVSAGASNEAIAPADNVREYSRFDRLGD